MAFLLRAIPLLNVDGSLRMGRCAYRYNRKTTAANTCRKRISLSQHNLFLSSMIAIFKRRYDYRNCKRCYYQNLGQGKNIIEKFTIMPEIIEQGFAEILADVYKTGILFMLMKHQLA
jgi:hypothetical protein